MIVLDGEMALRKEIIDLETAIKHYKGLQKRYTKQHNEQHCQYVATALKSMQWDLYILQRSLKENT